jgi:large subunit ribosomal protein L4
LRQKKLIAVEHPKISKPKTKEMINFLKKISLDSVLLIVDELDKNLYLSSRNIPNVDVVMPSQINPLILLKAKNVAVTPAAFKVLENLI